MVDAYGLTVGVRQTPSLDNTLRRAVSYAQQRSHRYVTLEHLLLALTDDPDVLAMLRAVNGDVIALRERAADVVNRQLSTLYAPGNTELRPSYKFERILNAAASEAAHSAGAELDGAFVAAALTAESESMAAGLLRQQGLGHAQAMRWLELHRRVRPGMAARPANENIRRPASPPSPQPKPKAPHAANGASRDKAAAAPAGNVPPAAAGTAIVPYRDRKLSRALAQVRPEDGDALPAIRPGPGLKVAAGKLVENIPRKMQVGRAEQIEVRISREETEALFQGFSGSTETHDIVVTRAMTVMLRAPDEGFTIETLAPETQWVFDRPSFIETERFGRWRWIVTPQRAGKKRLQLIVAARTVDAHGMAGDTALPDQVIDVQVRTNYGRALGRLVSWTFLLAVGGVIGKFGEVYLPQLWPLAKAVLRDIF